MSMILTFYSYKGGVGRTMALANIAYLLAKMGKSVLAVDWDLEAPGLERYFADFKIEGPEDGRGLIDLLIDASSNSQADWALYLSSVSLGSNAELFLMTSGAQNKDYASRVLGFNWESFFKNSDGGAFIESLRESWLSNFDITLIDSRTGITDAGGICTHCCPAKTPIKSTAWRNRSIRIGSPRLGRPAKWALFQKW